MSKKMPEPVTNPDGSVSINGCINYLNGKYGYYGSDPEREIEVAKLWGFKAGDLNEKSRWIYRFEMKRETIEVAKIKGSCAFCCIHLARAPNEKWAAGSSISLAQCGRGGFPSIWNRTQYPDRQSAINAELESLIVYCQKSDDKLAGEKLKILKNFKVEQNAPQQLDLFEF